MYVKTTPYGCSEYFFSFFSSLQSWVDMMNDNSLYCEHYLTLKMYKLVVWFPCCTRSCRQQGTSVGHKVKLRVFLFHARTSFITLLHRG